MLDAVRVIAFALLCAGAGAARADDTAAASGASLRARYLAMQEQLGSPLSGEAKSDSPYMKRMENLRQKADPA